MRAKNRSNYTFTMDLRTVVCVFLFVTWTIATHDGPPVIKEHPEDVLTRRNEPATLNCAAPGATKIQWYRDGDPVLTDSHESRSERVLLFEGSLYFMRVTANRRQNDAGTYWCVASNERGSTKSNTATLTIASIGSQFLLQPPPSVRARQGEPLTLPCRAPKGVPSPEVRWERDGQMVVNTTRVMTSLEGDLVFDDVIEEDAGTYVCVAQNLAGTRESQPSSVHITSPPWFVERPKNISTVAGATIEFECRARGSPPPTVIWRRLDGKMPLERTHLREKSSVLRLTEVSSSDSGMYVCEAENEAGKAMTLGSLKVVVAPEVKEKPGNTLTLVGKDLTLKCEVKGEPTPLLVWKLPHHDQQTLLSGGQSNKHASVSPTGTALSLQALEKDDTGAYYCWGISSGGGVSSRAEVVVVEAFPPPLIGVRPNDLHVPPGSTASFPCEVASEASAPTITWWFRRAAHLEPHQVGNGASVTQLQTGTLVLKEVTEEDAGIYECRVSSGAGTVEAEAILRVEEGAAGPHAGRRSSASLAPAPPSKPRIVYYNSSAAQLTWLPNSRGNPGEGADSYTVEYWRSSWQEWRVAKADIRDTSALIEDLTPNSAYVFLVRAINARGESFPSPWSDMIYTSGPGGNGVNLEEERQTRRKLNRPTVALVSARSSSSTLVTLTWELLEGIEVPVDGVIVYTVGEDSVETATVFGVASNSHRVRGLKPNTRYTFFLVPFSKTIEGIPSNSLGLTTPQEAPSVSPSGLTVETFGEGTTLVKWTPLTEAEAGGDVIGYHVSTTHNSTSTLRETDNPWLELRGLEQGRLYTVRVAGVSGGGVGPWSPPELIDMSSGTSGARGPGGEAGEEEDVPSVFYTQPHPFWVLYITVPVLLLLVVLGMIYLVNVRRKATPSTLDAPMGSTLYSSSGVYGPPHQVNMYGDQKVWRPSDSDQDSSLSSARLLRPEHLANEYAEPRLHRPLQEAPTEPYATTALLAPASPRPGRTTNHGWRPCPEDIQLNWAALIPPPPSCPPPPNFPSHEGETCSSASTSESGDRRHYLTGSSSQYENAGGCSEQYERPCDFASHCSGDPYSPPGATPLEGFQTFNTLQGTPGRRVTVDLHPTRVEPPKSNTH